MDDDEYASSLDLDHTVQGWAYCTDAQCRHAVRAHLASGRCTFEGCPCDTLHTVGPIGQTEVRDG